MSGGVRRSGACLRCCLVIFAVASALCVSGPAIYSKYKKGFAFSSTSTAATVAACGPCVCDCPPPLSIRNVAPGLFNLSVADCGKDDSELIEEMQKEFVDLLIEELKLQEAVAKEHDHHMNATLLEAKRLGSQYQKEAEKCNIATETCEGARERAEAALSRERKLTFRWEQRARQLGWEGE